LITLHSILLAKSLPAVYHNKKLGLGLAPKLLSYDIRLVQDMLCFYISFGGKREREKIIRPFCVSASVICISVCHYGGRQSFQCGAALKMMMMRPYEYVQCIFCSCTIFHGRGGVLLPAFAKARHGSSSRGSSSPTDVMSTLKKSGVHFLNQFVFQIFY